LFDLSRLFAPVENIQTITPSRCRRYLFPFSSWRYILSFDIVFAAAMSPAMRARPFMSSVHQSICGADIDAVFCRLSPRPMRAYADR